LHVFGNRVSEGLIVVSRRHGQVRYDRVI
jgi:hypothetical protein